MKVYVAVVVAVMACLIGAAWTEVGLATADRWQRTAGIIVLGPLCAVMVLVIIWSEDD